MDNATIWAARDQVSKAYKAWNASGTPVGSSEHAAYMAAKQTLEQVKRATPSAKPVILAPAPLGCCSKSTLVNRPTFSMGITTCPVHGEIHHGTQD